MPDEGFHYPIKRKAPRRTCCNVIRFWLTRSFPDKSYRGLTINISDSGMCLYSPNRFFEGEDILVQEKISSGYRRAKVVWVRNYLAGLHKAGLKFHE